MDLKQSLEKFKKRQEECQATLTSIAAKQSASRITAPRKENTPNAAPAFTGRSDAVKFSDDTGRLQYINSIRKAPVGAQIKRVIDLLLQTRQSFTSEQINETCYVDVKGNKEVFDSLKNNVKVHYDGKRFWYKAKHDVKDQNGLLHLIRGCKEGIAVIDLKDAYPKVMDDLKALKASGQICVLSNSDSHEEIAYPNDPRLQIKVDEDLKELFRSIELPRDMIDIEKELLKNGMKPATNTSERRAAAHVGIVASKPKLKKKRTREITKRTRLTNVHLPELFERLRS